MNPSNSDRLNGPLLYRPLGALLSNDDDDGENSDIDNRDASNVNQNDGLRCNLNEDALIEPANRDGEDASPRQVTPPPVVSNTLQGISTGASISNKTAGHYVYDSTLPMLNRAQVLQLQLEKESRGKYVGTMMPQYFLDKYLPESSGATTIRRNLKWKQLREAFPTKEMGTLHQYRMSLDKICRRLLDFKSTHEYVEAIADGMEAHECAYYEAQILHRDICARNFIITEEGEGLLIDWDLYPNMAKQPAQARRPERTGTWQFMSVGLLTNRQKLRNVNSDQESALYVLTWTALRYTHHSQLESLPSLLHTYNEVDQRLDNKMTGGRLKDHFLARGLRNLQFTDRPSLIALIDELRLHFHEIDTLPIPTQEAIDTVEKMKKLGLTKTLPGHETYQYQLLQERLKNRKWLVETFRKHLATETWPKDDRSNLNKRFLFPGQITAIKRSWNFEDRVGSFKSRRLSNDVNSNAVS